MSLLCFEILCSTVDNLSRDATLTEDFTLVERVKVIELNNKNRSARKIADDFGVGKTQVPKYMYIFLILNEYNFLILNAHMITAKTCTAFPSFTFIFGIMKYNM